ncbi:MAG: glycerophosphodiester phosphodiesterase [Deltaproteobacteria bacterium HGW-Deltaproteobacteria-4]|nr:MAG: glycerophosphodiester phosphodiesterase [Deltaproteobacteria bacterium HGW-Deltaproteobacteria-4]
MPVPLIIAHRGASFDAPENTLAAFRLAFAQGADGIEADFRLSGDGEIVCIHDALTGRTADRNLRVTTRSLAELRLLDFGGWKGPQWHGERIPTLAEVLTILPAGKKFFIEIKCGAEIIPPLRKHLTTTVIATEQLCFLSFDPTLLAALKGAFPKIKSCLNVEYHRTGLVGGWRPQPRKILEILADCGANGLSSQVCPLIDNAFVDGLRATSMELHIWTVDFLADARHYQTLGVDSLMSNRPGFLRQELFAESI